MLIAFVNGYGAPPYPEEDRSLARYLRAAVAAMDAAEDRGDHVGRVYLAGGNTNRRDLSEAEAMRRWFAAHDPRWLPRIRLVEGGWSAQENLRAFAGELRERESGDEAVAVFCAFSRVVVMRALSRRLLAGRETRMYPIPLLGESMGVRALAVQFARVPLEVLALRGGIAERVRRELRYRAILRARRASVGSTAR